MAFRTWIIVVAIFMAIPAGAFAQGTLAEARNLMEKGQYRQAEAVFWARTQKNDQDADSWYWWGVCRLKQGSSGDSYFLKAVGLKPKYSESIAPLYRQEAGAFMQKGRTDTAMGLFDKAIEWDKSLKAEIAQFLFDSSRYELAVRYNPGLADRVADVYFQRGDATGGESGLPYFREAKKYSARYNEEIKKRLLAIAGNKREEKDIGFWRSAAAEFGEIPPDYKIYEQGTYTFSLKAGEKLDHWIMFPLGMLLELSISSRDYNYTLLYDDGQMVKDGEDVVYPNKRRTKFKLIAITDQPDITMVVKDNRVTRK